MNEFNLKTLEALEDIFTDPALSGVDSKLRLKGRVYVDSGLEQFADAHGLDVWQEVEDCGDGPVRFLSCKLAGVELIQIDDWADCEETSL